MSIREDLLWQAVMHLSGAMKTSYASTSYVSTSDCHE